MDGEACEERGLWKNCGTRGTWQTAGRLPAPLWLKMIRGSDLIIPVNYYSHYTQEIKNALIHAVIPAIIISWPRAILHWHMNMYNIQMWSQSYSTVPFSKYNYTKINKSRASAISIKSQLKCSVFLRRCDLINFSPGNGNAALRGSIKTALSWCWLWFLEEERRWVGEKQRRLGQGIEQCKQDMPAAGQCTSLGSEIKIKAFN